MENMRHFKRLTIAIAIAAMFCGCGGGGGATGADTGGPTTTTTTTTTTSSTTESSTTVSTTITTTVITTTANTTTVTTTTLSTGNHAPVANAGADRNVISPIVVHLDGSGSSDADGDTLAFKWSIVKVQYPPSYSDVLSIGTTLSNSTTATPTFNINKVGIYVFGLTVNDGTVDSSPDTVTITAN